MLHWLDFLFPPRDDESVLRDVSIDEFLGLLAPRIIPATQPVAVSLLPYANKVVRAAIHEAKYHGSTKAFGFLASALLEYLRDDEGFTKPIIVPIPLSEKRLKERGFNQVEEVVSRTTGLIGGTIDTTLLVRTRDTLSQVSLPRDKRMGNMQGAFKATRPANPAYTYIIIDDVLTTGATLQTAIDALTEAGALHIIPIALAH